MKNTLPKTQIALTQHNCTHAHTYTHTHRMQIHYIFTGIHYRFIHGLCIYMLLIDKCQVKKSGNQEMFCLYSMSNSSLFSFDE